MFASKITSVVDLGGGNTAVVRKLSAVQLEAAAEARQARVAETMSRIGPEMIRSFQEAPDARERAKAAAEDPKTRYQAYDRPMVLRAGVVTWHGPDISSGATRPTDAQFDDLDEETADLLGRAIIDLSAPAPRVLEAAAKND